LKSILIVEDELIIAHDIKKTLQKYGYSIPAILDTGEDAIEFVLSSPPDLVLMDITLAGEIDGIDASAKIKEHIDIPLIFLTASNDTETLDRAKKLEPHGYINKPVKDTEIFTSLETALYKFNAEQKIKRNQLWLQAMLDSIGEGIISVDIDGMITYINEIAEKMTGYPKNDLVGKHKNTIIIKSPDDEIQHLPIASTHMGSPFVFLHDYSLVSLNGASVHVDINCAVVYDEKDEITGNIFSIRDVTERIKREEIIHKAAEEWRVTFDSITDSVFLTNGDGEVVRCNNSASELLRKPYNDIIGFNLNNLFGPIGNYIYQCFNDIRMTCSKRVFEQKIGNLWYSGKFDPIVDNESFIGAVIILSDITESKHNQEELEKYKNHLEEQVEFRTKELKDANKNLQNEISLRWLIAEQMVQLKEYAETASRSKSEFLANMSHELRTPLNSIIGFAKLIKMGIDPKESDNHLNNIISSGEHLLSMINDILNLSKMEAGKLKIDRSKIDIITVAAVSSDIVGVQAEEKNISLVLDNRTANEELMVYADRKRIQQVILNLLSNAVKFTENGGSVTLIIRKNEKTCFVDVIDTGIGIEKEKQKSIFDKFSQVDNSLSKKSEGTGLGLAISKSIVESHGGHMYVSSKIDSGSTFTFTLPIYNEAKHGTGETAKDLYPKELKDKRIQVVVTNDVQVANFVEFFTENNQKYSIVKRSDISSNSLKQRDLGAIIIETDENISHESQFVETITSLSNVPIVALSKVNNIQDRQAFLDMGYSLFYMVPCDLLDLVTDIYSIYYNSKRED
jgi:PAS domain S-box-containing protein